jgi:phage FluMu protein Com
MSVSVRHTIRCDKCSEWIVSAEDEPLSYLRKYAKEEGWTYRKERQRSNASRDLCPKCNTVQESKQ